LEGAAKGFDLIIIHSLGFVFVGGPRIRNFGAPMKFLIFLVEEGVFPQLSPFPGPELKVFGDALMAEE